MRVFNTIYIFSVLALELSYIFFFDFAGSFLNHLIIFSVLVFIAFCLLIKETFFLKSD